MVSWDERYAAGEYPSDPEPSPVLRHFVSTLPSGSALDIAAGTGRNALFLAEHNFEVDAIDKSRIGLEQARLAATQKSVNRHINWIHADVNEFTFPESRYDLITVSFYRMLDRLTDIKAALKDRGHLYLEHHLRSVEPTPSGPRSNQYRFGANELLRACLDLTILYYDESTSYVDDNRARANVRLFARKANDSTQSYPPSII